MEIADYGTDRRLTPHHDDYQRPERENPIDTFNIEYMTDRLLEQELGELHPYSRFVNEVVWGQQPGAIRLWVTPGYGVFIDRLGVDLVGQPKWYTKRYYQINRHGYGGYEETVTSELVDHLDEIQKLPYDSPKTEFPNLQRLVLNMTDKIKRSCRPIFLFDEVRKLNENNYLIVFNVRGQGLQAPDQRRVEKNVTEVVFYPGEGCLRVLNRNYESPLSQHKWEVSVTHSDMCFFPTQPAEEILEPIATIMRFY